VGHGKARVGWPVSWVLAMPLLAAAPPTRCLARGCMSRTDVMRTGTDSDGRRRQRARNRRTGATCASAKRSRFQIHVTDKTAPATVRVRTAVAGSFACIDDGRARRLAGNPSWDWMFCFFGVAPVAFRQTCPRIEDLQSIDVHVHLSLRHRQRAFPPRRFVCPPLGGELERGGRSLWVRRIWGRGSADGVGRPIARGRGPPADAFVW
jgi:hypothetical protein